MNNKTNDKRTNILIDEDKYFDYVAKKRNDLIVNAYYCHLPRSGRKKLKIFEELLFLYKLGIKELLNNKEAYDRILEMYFNDLEKIACCSNNSKYIKINLNLFSSKLIWSKRDESIADKLSEVLFINDKEKYFKSIISIILKVSSNIKDRDFQQILYDQKNLQKLFESRLSNKLEDMMQICELGDQEYVYKKLSTLGSELLVFLVIYSICSNEKINEKFFYDIDNTKKNLFVKYYKCIKLYGEIDFESFFDAKIILEKSIRNITMLAIYKVDPSPYNDDFIYTNKE